MAITRQGLTLEQFLRLPAEEPALEYWRGEVTQKVSPKGPHGALQYGFGRRIDDVGPLRATDNRDYLSLRVVGREGQR